MYWNERAQSVKSEKNVNIGDIFQREIEYDYFCRYLKKEMTVFEVGCGNGYSTARFRPLVHRIDSIDKAENMIKRAKSDVGEENNTFILDNILKPEIIKGPYDAGICVRVLINLENLDEQLCAIHNMAALIKPGGLLILFEGFLEGFSELDGLRRKVGLPRIAPAKINFYSSLDDIMPALKKHFLLKEHFHLGSYDFLTRVVYPLVTGPENIRHNTKFSEKSSLLAREFNPEALESFSRMKGFLLEKKT